MVVSSVLSRVVPLDEELATLAEELRPSIVLVRSGQHGAGTGVVWSPNGVVVTNSHVVGGDTAEIVFAGGRRVEARLEARDRENDLAALRVDGVFPGLAVAADSRDLRVGQLVVAMGHPLGVENAVTVGILSGLPDPAQPRELIRSDLHLNPGNSGGPLVDVQGRVVGINAMVAGPGTALSIPSHVVQSFLARGGENAPYFGLQMLAVALPESYRAALPHPAPAGVMVTGVEPGSPAERAGLLTGDVIVGANGRDAWYPTRLRDEILLAGNGGSLRLTVLRAGHLQQISGTVGQRV